MTQIEKIVETKSCRICSASFDITDKDREFYEKVSPTFSSSLEKEPVLNLIGQGESGNNPLIKDLGDGKIKYLIPTPALCPDCRQQRRMSWSNQRNLYHRKCDGTGKIIISNISPDKNMKVYDTLYWYTDNWNQNATGRDFDFSKSFFEQFENLLHIAPIPSLQRSPKYDENADYTNYAGKNKNCYLIFDSDKNEKCYYSYSINSCDNVIDCFRVGLSSFCYQCVDCVNSYHSTFLQNCKDCADSHFLKDCIGCKNCFGCVNLVNNEYCIFNKKYTKEEYKDKIQSLQLSNPVFVRSFRKEFQKFSLKFPNKYTHGVGNENCVGDYLDNCKNANFCYDSRFIEDGKYIQQAYDTVINSMDCTEIGDQAEMLYEDCYMGYEAYNNLFSSHCLGTNSFLLYCFFTPFCSNCFGCVGLHHKEYCILNKQYTKEEYEQLVPQIIEHMMKPQPNPFLTIGEGGMEWGEFFPSLVSPFGYNETHAQEYFPIESLQLSVISQQSSTLKLCKLKTGNGELKINWSDYEKQNGYEGVFYTPLEIEQYDENMVGKEIAEKNTLDLLQGILQCEVSKKPFKIIKQELEFYKDLHIALPRRHPDQRHIDRSSIRNTRTLFNRKCDKCRKEIQTTYAPERPEIVYCEECYNKAMY